MRPQLSLINLNYPIKQWPQQNFQSNSELEGHTESCVALWMLTAPFYSTSQVQMIVSTRNTRGARWGGWDIWIGCLFGEIIPSAGLGRPRIMSLSWSGTSQDSPRRAGPIYRAEVKSGPMLSLPPQWDRWMKKLVWFCHLINKPITVRCCTYASAWLTPLWY